MKNKKSRLLCNTCVATPVCPSELVGGYLVQKLTNNIVNNKTFNYIKDGKFPNQKETTNGSKGWLQVLVVIKEYICIPLAKIGPGDSLSYKIVMYNKKKFYENGIEIDNVLCWMYLPELPTWKEYNK